MNELTSRANKPGESGDLNLKLGVLTSPCRV